MPDIWAETADRAFADCHSKWVLIFSSAANPLWSGKPPETFWSNSWLEEASLKTDPFSSLKVLGDRVYVRTRCMHAQLDPACLCQWESVLGVCECVFRSMNVHLCPFIIVCLAWWFPIKPYRSRNLKLAVLSKNRRLNQCSHVSPAAALRVGSARAHTCEARKPRRDHRREIPGFFRNALWMRSSNIYSWTDKNMSFCCSSQ